MSKCGKCEAHSWRSMMATDVTVWESNELSCLLFTPVLRRLVFLGPVFLKVGLRSSVSSFWGARLLPPQDPFQSSPRRDAFAGVRGAGQVPLSAMPAPRVGLWSTRSAVSGVSLPALPPNLSRKPLKSKMFS